MSVQRKLAVACGFVAALAALFHFRVSGGWLRDGMLAIQLIAVAVGSGCLLTEEGWKGRRTVLQALFALLLAVLLIQAGATAIVWRDGGAWSLTQASVGMIAVAGLALYVRRLLAR